MLLSGLIKLIKTAFDGFVNLLVFLLVKAGMWVPAVFSLIFITVCIAFDVKFSAFTTGLFISGLIASAVIGSVTAFRHKVKLKRAVPPKKKVRYLDKSQYKSLAKGSDFNVNEWDNSQSAASRPVADEDRIVQYNKNKAYKEPEPIDGGFYQDNSGGYGQGRINNADDGRYSSQNYGHNQGGYDGGNYGNQGHGGYTPDNHGQYGNQGHGQGGYRQDNYGQYGNQQGGYSQNNGRYNDYNRPKESPSSGGRWQNQKPDSTKYEDFNELKQKYFGSGENVPPQDETAATQNGFPNRNGFGNQNNGFGNVNGNPNSGFGNMNGGFGNANSGSPNGGFGNANGFSAVNNGEMPAHQGGGSFGNAQSGARFSPESGSERNSKSAFDKFFDGTYNRNETPMVFSTRRDPDILIYEFSDRLEFYRKSPNGLVLLSVERKV